MLRQAQGYAQLDPKACNNKHHAALAAALPAVFPFAPTPHALRGVYAQCVFAHYACACTFNRCAMRAGTQRAPCARRPSCP